MEKRSTMSARAELHQLVEQLSDTDAEVALDYLHELLDDDEQLTDVELELAQQGEAEIARGDVITLAELRRRTSG
jgi:hypothetical protein